MLSYLHGFHAGNHADVLKHMVLVHQLDYLTRKHTPVTCIDTHAGAGRYRLDDDRALQNAEHLGGVARLWGRTDLPPSLARWLDVVREMQASPAALTEYPGSPAIAARLLRADDPLHLFELHPREVEALEEHCGRRRRTHIKRSNGFKDALGLLPPPSRRGFVLVDPPYEMKTDYEAVVRFIAGVCKRFATCAVALWYPVVERGAVDVLRASIKAVGATDVLRAELRVAPDTPGIGMTGSGIFIINPAWTLRAALEESLPVLATALAADGQDGSFILETLVGDA